MFIPTWALIIILVYVFAQLKQEEVSGIFSTIIGFGILWLMWHGILLLIGAIAAYGFETVFGYVFGAMIIGGIPITIYEELIKPIFKKAKAKKQNSEQEE